MPQGRWMVPSRAVALKGPSQLGTGTWATAGSSVEVSRSLVICVMTWVCLLGLLVWGDSSGREEGRGGGEGGKEGERGNLAPVLEMVRLWGHPGGISETAAPSPGVQTPLHGDGTRVEGPWGESWLRVRMASLRGSGVTPALCIPRCWRAGPREEAPVPLPAEVVLELTQGPYFICSGSEASSHRLPLPTPSHPNTHKKRTRGQYSTSLLLHWLGPCRQREEQSRRRAPQGRTPPKQTGRQQEGQSHHLPARGPSRRQRATPCTQQGFISPRHTLRQRTKVLSTCRRRDPEVGPATRQGPSLSPSPSHTPGNSLENSSGETQAPRVFRAVLVSVASDVILRLHPTCQLAVPNGSCDPASAPPEVAPRTQPCSPAAGGDSAASPALGSSL